MNISCRDCMRNKHLNSYPEGTPQEKIKEYQESVIMLTDKPGAVPTGPEVFYEVKALKRRLFGEGEMNYSEIKYHFNALMLEIEPELERRVLSSEDPLKSAVQYAMMGNFIDFAALDNVEESKLMELIDRAPDITVDSECLEKLREKVTGAKTLVHITDNCGEIVMDKILLRQFLRMNPNVKITVIVRGAPVANDATMEDAEQVGLTELGHCIGNGTPTDGTVLRLLSRQAREAVALADVVIAKGQANYETLYGCGYNVFFIFMCKCMLFMDRFKVPQFTGILTFEDPEILLNVYADEAMLKRFRFRPIRPEEAREAWEIDNLCFPANEAMPMEVMREFVETIPGEILVAQDRQSGKIAGFVSCLAADEDKLRDEFFTNVSLHDPAAQTAFGLGLDVRPGFRHQGLARELVHLYSIWCQVKGRRRIIMTSHEELIGMYEKMGFTDLGISDSAWGGSVWHEMYKSLDA